MRTSQVPRRRPESSSTLGGAGEASASRHGRSDLLDNRPRTAFRTRWQPRVRRRAIDQAATTRGIAVETRAPPSASTRPQGAPTTPGCAALPSKLELVDAARLFDAAGTAAEEAELSQIVADGLAYVCFRDGGRRAQGLDVRLADVDYMIIDR